MIGWLSKEKKEQDRIIDFNILSENIEIIKKIKNKNRFEKYIIKLFEEYELFLKNNYNNVHHVTDNLKKEYCNNFEEISNDITKINDCNIILSSSHENTFYILKELNKTKEENVLVICLDMHSDTYDYNDNLWKGNVFSKLLKENYINSFVVLGVPKEKISYTKKDISKDVKKKISIAYNYDVKKYLKKYKPTTVFISIDIDCLNTRNDKITALEYCPMTILKNLSMISLKEKSSEEIKKIIMNSIYVKNDLGYANLYKVGENKLNLKMLIDIIKKIKYQCMKNGINLGFNYKNHIWADITEIFGYDYGNLTSELIIKIISELI